jgi:hypothetical protein
MNPYSNAVELAAALENSRRTGDVTIARLTYRREVGGVVFASMVLPIHVKQSELKCSVEVQVHRRDCSAFIADTNGRSEQDVVIEILNTILGIVNDTGSEVATKESPRIT